MKRILLSTVAAMMLLAGCATSQVEYYKANEAIAVANAQAKAAKYTAIATLSNGAGDSARVAGVMALAFADQGGAGGGNSPQLAAPRSTSDSILQWLQVLAPTVVQAYGIGKNAQVAISGQETSRDVAVSTNSTFLGMAGKIQAPAANMTIGGDGVIGTGTYSQANPVLSGTGVIGTGTYSTTDTHAVDNHTTNPTTVVQIPAGKVCSIEPVTAALVCQ